MKKLSIIFALILAPGLFSSPAFAANYAVDYLESGNSGGWAVSSKSFDDAMGVSVGVGDTFDVDVWLRDCPATPAATSGGFWIDFQGSTALLNITSIQRYNGELPGPWSAGGTTNIGPIGSIPDGAAMAVTINAGGANPDNAGDIIIARVTLTCLASGIADVQVKTIPGYSTWSPDPPWHDAEIEPSSFTITSNSMPVTTTSVAISTTSAPSTTSSSSTTTTITPVTTTTTSSTTFTTTIPKHFPPCLSEKIYGENSKKVELLRNLRDNTLRKIPEGREIIKLYYRWSPALVRALEKDDEFKEQMRHSIDRILFY